MSRRTLLNVLAAAFVLVLLAWLGGALDYQPERKAEGPRGSSAPPAGHGMGGPSPSMSAAPPAGLAAAIGHVRHAEIGFTAEADLHEHFQKHGGGLGVDSPEAYLLLAQALRDRAPGGPVREAVRDDGVVTRYDRESGAFVAFDRDLTLRTFFRPADGERYFERQSRR